VLGEEGGLLELAIDKCGGHAPEDLLIDGAATVMHYLQQFNPSIKYMPNVKNSLLPVVTMPTESGNFPCTTMMAQMYFRLPRC